MNSYFIFGVDAGIIFLKAKSAFIDPHKPSTWDPPTLPSPQTPLPQGEETQREPCSGELTGEMIEPQTRSE